MCGLVDRKGRGLEHPKPPLKLYVYMWLAKGEGLEPPKPPWLRHWMTEEIRSKDWESNTWDEVRPQR